MVTREEVLKNVAFCSMFCTTCTGCSYGKVSEHAKSLLYYLNGHEEFLEKNLKKEYEHKLEEFQLFKKKLTKYAYPKCGGCRNNPSSKCSITGCIIPACCREKGIDFCAECSEFPCTKVNEAIYKKTTIKKWKEGNQRIKEIGLIAYYNENRKIPHYIEYTKNKTKKEAHS